MAAALRRLTVVVILGAITLAPAACGGDADEGAEKLVFESPAARIAPTAETDPIPRDGDADDAAIWVHPTDRAKSTIIGTDKQGGLAVYDLGGGQIQYRPDGDLNNVDLRQGFRLAGETVTLVTAADSTTDRLAIYRVDVSTRTLVDVAARRITVGIAAYGSCMFKSPQSGRLYVFVNSQEEDERPGGEVEQWQLVDNGAGRVDARKVRRFSVGSETEGCVADDRLGHLYIGEEEKGIWKYDAEPDAGTRRTLVDSTRASGHLEAEVEGLTIAYTSERSGYLIASSQGNSSFAVYRREGANDFVKTFKIGAARDIDAVEETDGIDVTTRDLGAAFPAGLLVAHDGRDDSGGTNFKLVRLGAESERPARRR